MKDYIGLKFGRLTVIKLHHKVRKNPSGYRLYYLCKCNCGNFKIANIDNLVSGYIQSCGCLRKECYFTNHRIHGMANSRLYKIWIGMKARCYNLKNKSYNNYGNRGITVCNEWKSDFMNFYNWAMNNGYNDDLTIDRIDVNGNYEPNNCRWVDRKVQANNTRTNHYITYNEETHTIAEWCRIVNISYPCFMHRIQRGWNIDRILNTPMRIIKPHLSIS